MTDPNHLSGILNLYRRPSTFAAPGFDVENPLWSSIRILVVGAGGLGCELLHSLALSGFHDMEVIDMDTIELSNLNRQFLFREKDIGRPKAVVAADFVSARCPNVKIKPHFNKIECMGDDFYRTFHLIVLGLDSVYARRWMNAKVAELAERAIDNTDGRYKIVDAIPLIDGGTEGYSGSVKLIKMGLTACIECTMWMYPPVKTVPMCTLENVPRMPEHCVLYAKEKLWVDAHPGVELDTDNIDHMLWITARAQERQKQFHISGVVDYSFCLGVVKNVVPAVGFTNAIVAGCTVLEVLKLVTAVAPSLNSYAFYNGAADGIASVTQYLEPNDECPMCASTAAHRTSFDVTPAEMVGKFLAGLPMNELWKLQPAPASSTAADCGSMNLQAALKVYVDGPASAPVYIKYSENNPLRWSDALVTPVATVREILLSKRPELNLEGGFLFESTANNLVARVFLRPE